MSTLAYSHALPPLLVECAYFVRRSRSLASMLPALLTSALVTLLFAGMANPLRGEFDIALADWLVAWAIAFPVAYLLGAALRKLGMWLSAIATRNSASRQGLALSDIARVSDRATAVHRHTVLRGLKPAHAFRA